MLDWSRAARLLRRALGYVPPTLEKAGREMAEAEAVPMTDEEIERIADVAIKRAAAENDNAHMP